MLCRTMQARAMILIVSFEHSFFLINTRNLPKLPIANFDNHPPSTQSIERIAFVWGFIIQGLNSKAESPMMKGVSAMFCSEYWRSEIMSFFDIFSYSCDDLKISESCVFPGMPQFAQINLPFESTRDINTTEKNSLNLKLWYSLFAIRPPGGHFNGRWQPSIAAKVYGNCHFCWKSMSLFLKSSSDSGNWTETSFRHNQRTIT